MPFLFSKVFLGLAGLGLGSVAMPQFLSLIIGGELGLAALLLGGSDTGGLGLAALRLRGANMTHALSLS